MGFLLLLQEDIVVGRLPEEKTQLTRKDDEHDVDLLNNDAIRQELLSHFLADCLRHLRLGVAHSVHAMLPDEVPNVLLAFFLQQLLETIWAEVVKELNDVLFFDFWALVSPSDVEVHSYIETDEHVILGRNLLNRAVEADRILRDQSGNFVCVTAGAVAPLGAGLHDAAVGSIAHAQSVHTVGNVELVVAAARAAVHDGH